MEKEIIYTGTELKMNVNIQPFGNVTMDDYDFNLELSTPFSAQTVKINKQDMVRTDADNYIAIADTTHLGKGEVKAVLTAYIPDGDMPDRLRTEVVSRYTGVVISAI